jgi:hypothetical protein
MEAVASGDGYWLASGFNRYDALRRVGCKYVPVDLYEGDKVDAQYISMTANNAHGLRRTNADKRKSVKMAINHQWMSDYSNRAIAEELGVGDDLVASVRKELEEAGAQSDETISRAGKRHVKEVAPPSPQKRKGRDGKSYSVKPKAAPKKQTAGKPKSDPADEPKPSAPCNSMDNKPNVATTPYKSDVVNWDLLKRLPEPDQIDAIMACLERFKEHLSYDGREILTEEFLIFDDTLRNIVV